MELRQYWQIIWRRVWILVVFTVIAGIASFVLSPRVQTSYNATTRVLVSIRPEIRNTGFFTYEEYYTWLTSEYLVDDLSEFVKSTAFTRAVQDELGGEPVDSINIEGIQRSKKTHRLLSLTAVSRDAAQAEKVAAAAGRVLEKNGSSFFAQLSKDNAAIVMIDTPVAVPQVSGMRSNLEIALRTSLGLIVGLGIILLLDYFDTSMRNASEVERILGVPVLGEIPAEKR